MAKRKKKLLKALGKKKKVKNSRKNPLSAKAVIMSGGKVLLLKQKKDGQWDLPGGKLDKNESVLRALKREVKEETNLKVTPVKPLTAVVKPREEQKDLLVISYLCITDMHIEKKLKLSNEHNDYKLVPLAKALNISIRTHHKRALERAHRHLSRRNSEKAA